MHTEATCQGRAKWSRFSKLMPLRELQPKIDQINSTLGYTTSILLRSEYSIM